MNSAHLPHLEGLIQEAGGAVPLLRSSPLPAYAFPGQPDNHYTWREEHRAWRESVALFDMSFHMTELRLMGTEVIPFLQKFAVNKLGNFPVRTAKQLIAAGPDGNMIGDTIISREEEGLFRIIGVPLVHDWLEFNLIDSPFDVTFERNEAWTPFSHHDRDIYRLAIQGPHTAALLTELLGGEIPEVKFFRIGEMQIAGRTVRALRHSMAGQYGFELYGPWADHLAVRDAIQEIGPKYGLRTVGGLQPALPVESGWLALPVPAIYTHPDLKAYREWLDTTRLGTIASLRGSFVSDRIEDYYVTPLEAGYGNFVDWEQDFVGRDALRETADSPRRTKVTLEWNDEDVTAAIGAGLFGRPNPGRFISLPQLAYGSYQNDAIRLDGDIVGLSQTTIYSSNAEHVLSNSVVAVEHAHPGTELTVDWGDPTLPAGGDNGHEIRKIRVKVAPSPYFERLTRF